MVNEIKVFANKEFGQIRTLIINGEPWFVGKDVAEILGYSNTKDALVNHVDEDDRRIIQRSENATFDIPNRGLIIINESGLYSLILSSKLPSAKKFKHWITSEILPTLRKTGKYKMRNNNTCAYANAKDAIAKWKQVVVYPLVNRLGKLITTDDTVSIYRYIYSLMKAEYSFNMNEAKSNYCQKYNILDGNYSIIDVIADDAELRREFRLCACKCIKHLSYEQFEAAKQFYEQSDSLIGKIEKVSDDFETVAVFGLEQIERDCFAYCNNNMD